AQIKEPVVVPGDPRRLGGSEIHPVALPQSAGAEGRGAGGDVGAVEFPPGAADGAVGVVAAGLLVGGLLRLRLRAGAALYLVGELGRESSRRRGERRCWRRSGS